MNFIGTILSDDFKADFNCTTVVNAKYAVPLCY